MTPNISRRTTLVVALLIIAAGPSAWAADFPEKPIRMIVAFPAGGSADINARIFAQQLGTELGGQIVVENRGGAGGNLGAVEAKRSTPDGHTIFYATSAVALAPSVYKTPGFDPYTDFTPISLTATIPLVLVASPKVPATTAKEFVAWMKSQNGQVNFASSGRGAILHLAGELFLRETGTKASHVSYRGSAPAVNDLVGGNTHFMLLPANEAIGQVESGSLKAFAVTHTERLPQLPNVPTMEEALGLSTMNMGAWQGVLVPKGVPPAVVEKLKIGVAKAVANAETRRRITQLGSIMLGGSDTEYAQFTRTEGERWARVARDANAKAD